MNRLRGGSHDKWLETPETVLWISVSCTVIVLAILLHWLCYGRARIPLFRAYWLATVPQSVGRAAMKWASGLLVSISQVLIFSLRQDFFRQAFWEILPFEFAAAFHIMQIFWQGHPNAHQAMACAYSALALGAAVAQLQSRCDTAVIIAFVGFAAVRTVGPVLFSDKPANPKHALLVWQMFLMQLLCAVGVYGAIFFGYLPTVQSAMKLLVLNISSAAQSEMKLLVLNITSAAQSEMKLLVLNITSAAQTEMKLLVLNITSAAQNDMKEGMERGFQKIAGLISRLGVRESVLRVGP